MPTYEARKLSQYTGEVPVLTADDLLYAIVDGKTTALSLARLAAFMAVSGGLSAYELAVQQGFDGTLTEWLESLIGPAGAAGQPGSDGEPGHSPVIAFGVGDDADRLVIDGVAVGPHLTGAPGAEGPAGPKGDDGIPGIDGKTIHTVTGAPADGFGANGDYSYDPTSKVMYGPKAAGIWPAGVPLTSAGAVVFDAIQALTTPQQLQARKNIGITRQTASVTTASLAASAGQSGTVPMALAFSVLAISTNYPARVRLYDTVAHRDADITRRVGQDPEEGAGCLFEFISTATLLTSTIAESVNGFNGESSPSQNIPYRIDNLDTVSRAVTVSLTYLPLE